jgi:hypothetical protein
MPLTLADKLSISDDRAVPEIRRTRNSGSTTLKYMETELDQSLLSLAFEEALLHERCSAVYAGKVRVLWRNYLATPSNRS